MLAPDWTPPVLPSLAEPLTERLQLRQWQDTDRAPFAALNADPAVMRYFPALQDGPASQRSIDAWQQTIAERGWGNWAVALRHSGEFIGFVGLTVPRRVFDFSPCVEVGWRLAAAHWGRGYASEAARAALALGFGPLALDEIVSFTSVLNTPSQAVMRRIGLRDSGHGFDHPGVPEGHALRRHVLYRLSRRRWLAGDAAA